MADAPPYLSPSSASTFEQCPRRWKHKYVDRLPEPSGHAAVAGVFVHEVLEHLCQREPSERTQDAARVIARELWPLVEDDPDFQALSLSEDEARAFRWQAWLAVAGLWRLENPTEVDVVATEQKVNAELGGVPFLGIVDRLERSEQGYLVVSDYKSGALPGPRFRDDKLEQVLLYAGAIEQTHGEQPERARLLYLGQRTLTVTVTPDRVEEVSQKLAETWNRLLGACSVDVFPANPTVLCGWCPFAEICPEGQAELDTRMRAGTLPDHAPGRVLVA